MGDRSRAGLHRGYWGFSGWAQHDEAVWQEVKAEAQVRARKGLADYTSHFYGSDSDARVIEKARSNARRAGIADLMTFDVKDVAKLSNPLPKGPYGTVISNPPYGERLDSEPALIALHSLLGRTMKTSLAAGICRCSAPLRICSAACNYVPTNSSRRKTARWIVCRKTITLQRPPRTANLPRSRKIMPTACARTSRNWKNGRVRKALNVIACMTLTCRNTTLLWIVTVIGSWFRNMRPPKTVDAQKARQRLFDIIAATLSVLEIAPNKLVLKTRERQKGKNQYQKMNEKGNSLR